MYSEYQRIDVVESKYYGRILILDGVVQLTERDADGYNEMMAHVPMMAVKDPKRVLIIGGGDGYVLSEVSRVAVSGQSGGGGGGGSDPLSRFGVSVLFSPPASDGAAGGMDFALFAGRGRRSGSP